MDMISFRGKEGGRREGERGRERDGREGERKKRAVVYQ